MNNGKRDPRPRASLLREIEELQRRLEEAEQTIDAIRRGEVDAIVVGGPHGEQIYTLAGAEHAYRVIVETMNEAALMTDLGGTILFCNQRFCDLMRAPMREALGRKVTQFAAPSQQPTLEKAMADAQAGPVRRHLTLRAADGTAVPVLLSAGLLRTIDSISLCLVASDLTELEQSARSVRTLREQRQALAASEERYRRFFMDDLTGDFLANPDGALVECNPAFAYIYGFESVAKAPRHDISQFNPSDWLRLIERLKKRGRIYNHESWHKRPDGTKIHIVANVVGEFDDAGTLTAVKGYVFENTDSKHAEEALRESEQRYHRLFEDDLTGNFISTPAGEILLCNPAFARMFGFSSAQDAVGENVLDLYIDPRERELLLDRLRQQGKIERLEVWRKRVDGELIYIVENLVARFEGGGELRDIIGYLFDDTERKRAEEDLRELNATLESRVAKRTAELEHRTRQLQKLALELSQAEDRERRRLAEILHDDLQQQIAAAKFHMGLIRGRVKGDPYLQKATAKVEEMLVEAVQKSRSLSHELSPVILQHGTLREALGWLADQMQTKHGLAVHVAGQVNSDSEALKTFLYRAAQEMLFNVVKHARTSEARVRLRRLGQCLYLSVSDEGRGFDPQALKAAKGFGLLSIRERVELMGGRMTIKSAEGQGSTLFIAVADTQVTEDGGLKTEDAVGASPRGRPVRTRPTKGNHRGSRLRVLLVDDHEIVRDGLASVLNEHGDIEVVGQASDGRAAINQAYRLQPDVIVMDVAMPLMNGDEATAQIKRRLPGTRIVGLSMFHEKEAVERMQQAGAEGYVLKTAPFEDLLAAIRGKPAAKAEST